MSDPVEDLYDIHINKIEAASKAICAKIKEISNVWVCIDCEELLSKERKLAAPWSYRCAKCQTLTEQIKRH